MAGLGRGGEKETAPQTGDRRRPTRGESTTADRKMAALLGASVLLFAIWALPGPAPLERAGNVIPLTAAGKTCLGIMAFAVTLWVTRRCRSPRRRLLVVLLIPALGIADFREVVRASFGDPVIVFFIGVLILAAAFTQSGLGTRLTYLVLLRVGTRTSRVLLGFLIVGTLISMWITDIAVAAMLFPVGVGLLQDAGLRPAHSNFRPCADDRHCVRSTDWRHRDASRNRRESCRDCATQATRRRGRLFLAMDGPGRTCVAADDSVCVVDSSVDVSARNRTASHQPRGDTRTAARSRPAAPRGMAHAPRFRDGRHALAVHAASNRGRGLGGGVAMFLPGLRVLSWKDAEAQVEWGGVMLIVAGLSLGLVLFESGAARWLAWVLLGQITSVPDALRPVRHRARRRCAAHAVLEQHGDCDHHHPHPRRAGDGPAPRSVDDGCARGVHLFARIHSGQRRADDDHPYASGISRFAISRRREW
jgi:sodium-dependent dicarboxylate transporter 2/3/5